MGDPGKLRLLLIHLASTFDLFAQRFPPSRLLSRWNGTQANDQRSAMDRERLTNGDPYGDNARKRRPQTLTAQDQVDQAQS